MKNILNYNLILSRVIAINDSTFTFTRKYINFAKSLKTYLIGVFTVKLKILIFKSLDKIPILLKFSFYDNYNNNIKLSVRSRRYFFGCILDALANILPEQMKSSLCIFKQNILLELQNQKLVLILNKY